MKFYKMKKVWIISLALLVALSAPLTAMAAALSASIQTVVGQPGESKTVTLNSVVDMAGADWDYATSVTFGVYGPDGNQVGMPVVKQKPPIQDVSVSNNVYSLLFSDVSFSGLQSGTLYSLKASYTGASGAVTVSQPLEVAVVKSHFSFERKDQSGVTRSVQDNMVRSDDQNVVLTIRDDQGVAFANRQIKIEYGSTPYSLTTASATTDADGKITLLQDGVVALGEGGSLGPITYVSANYGNVDYWIEPIYAEDKLVGEFENNYIVEVRNLDKAGHTQTAQSGNYSFNGSYARTWTKQGLDILLINQIPNKFTDLVSNNGESYLYESSGEDVAPPISGKRRVVTQDASQFTAVTLNYTLDSAPLALNRVSIASNDDFKRLPSGEVNIVENPGTIYVKSGSSYQLTASAALADGNKMLIRQAFTASGSSMNVGEALQSGQFSAVTIHGDFDKDGKIKVRTGYLNDRYNYTQMVTEIPNDHAIWMKKNEAVYKIGVAIDDTYRNNDAVLATQWTPTNAAYSLKSGKTIVPTVNESVSLPYLDSKEERDQLILGETVSFDITLNDEYGNWIDKGDGLNASIFKGNEVIQENAYVLRNPIAQQSGFMEQHQLIFTPSTSGDYTVKFYKEDIQNYQVVNVLIGEKAFHVAPKKEIDVEVRDAGGTLLDLLNKPYVTNEQAKNLTITAREHVTGGTGALLKDVNVLVGGETLGKTSASGTFSWSNSTPSSNYTLTLSLSGYMYKTFNLQVIDPTKQAVVRVTGLDRAETNPAGDGGVPMKGGNLYANIKVGDQVIQQTYYGSSNSDVQYVAVPAPSVVNMDFVRNQGIYQYVNSPYGYYMLGSVQVEPGKEYSMVLDARSNVQQVAKVLPSQTLDSLSIVRKGLAGASYLPVMIDDNPQNQNYFYATKGMYSIAAKYANQVYYFDSYNISGDQQELNIPTETQSLARLQTDSGVSLSQVNYITSNNSQVGAYFYEASTGYVTPGNLNVDVEKFGAAGQMNYTVHFEQNQLQANGITQIHAGDVAGLTLNGLHGDTVRRSGGEQWLRFNLQDSYGNIINYIQKPYIYIFNNGSDIRSDMVSLEAASYTVKDSSGKTVSQSSDNRYPGYVYVDKDGDYTVEGSVTWNGQVYSFNKAIKVQTVSSTVVDPSTPSSGTDISTGTPGGGGTTTNPGNNGGSSGNPGGSTTGSNTPSTGPAASNTSGKNVEEQNKQLSDLAATKGSDSDLSAKAGSILTSIADSVKKVTDSKSAEQAAQQLAQTLDQTAKLLSGMKDEKEKAKLVDTVQAVVSSSQYALDKLDGSKAAEAAQSLIRNVAGVLNNSGSKDDAKLEQLKNSVIDLSKKAAEKASAVTLDSSALKIEGNAVSTQLDAAKVAQQIQAAQTAWNQLKGDLASVVGADRADQVKPVLNIVMNKPSDNVNKLSASLPSDLIEQVQKSGLGGIKMEMGNVGFTVEPDTFGDLPKGTNVSLSAEIVQNAVITSPASVDKLATIPVMEFKASVGDQKVDKFTQPIPVSFDVSSIDTSKYSESDLAQLTVYMLNENTLSWEPVGGKYDPVTKKVNVLRSHFSKYTVMKSNKKFADIPSTYWAGTAVQTLLNKGILDDTEKFQPDAKVTREEFTAWIIRLYGMNVSSAAVPFADVDDSNPYREEIAGAYAAGIIDGKEEGQFAPKDPITRQEIATILTRAMKKYSSVKEASRPTESIRAFKDGDQVAQWAQAGVATVYVQGLVDGYPDGSFKPVLLTSKAEAATLIFRLYNK